MIAADAEDALIEQAQQGSMTAFARLVGAHQQPARAFLRRICGDWSEADDLAQEEFVAAWAGLGAFQRGRDFRLWLYGIAYRKFLTSRRTATRRRAREAELAAARPAGSQTEDLDARLDLRKAMSALPPEQRAAVALCLAAGVSHGDAAELLGLPLGTVKSHVQRGRATLLSLLKDQDDER